MTIDFDKTQGLVPAIVQDSLTGKVLMLGFMNEEALQATRRTGKVTFFSRSRQCLWMKGETSGNTLDLVDILCDCDSDTLLVKARPNGPICHTGSETCFGEDNAAGIFFLQYLQEFIAKRKEEMPQGSYTTTLFSQGINRMAQKVGEEAVETVIESTNGTDEGLLAEASDLLYHLIVLLAAKGYSLDNLAQELKKRHK
ncbi:MAG: bifunctional phosphoribosyl-AMP cyclohydrolase/phosphoribosyl-ATP diphosphatase HisIE [Tannerellaceae bacterium]|jgi:phosphoribosyl-ATP pyrophosphohydrolase/phosphoribosyl-AMP cyclohydrolase|nr:bifunctional phosphoribosyl-AMP cyclohydrolase/phosphoribosyl-ATP diphosphatase HisIE [Tannerellaceae bacterium]